MLTKKKKNHNNSANSAQTKKADIIKDDVRREETAGKEDKENAASLSEETAEKSEAPVLSDTLPIPGNLTEILMPEEKEEKPEPLTGSILEDAVNEARERLTKLDEQEAAKDAKSPLM